MKPATAFLLLALSLSACKRDQEPSRRGYRSGGAPRTEDPGTDKAPPAPRPRAGALDLGPPGEILPPGLTGVRLGLTLEELKRTRPGVFATPTGQVATEDSPAGTPYLRMSYHFHEGRLETILLTLRDVETLSGDFLVRARAKWGAPSQDPVDRALEKRYAERGDEVVSWRLPGHLVRAEKRKREGAVRIYVTRR
jgi:hypothetical protein